MHASEEWRLWELYKRIKQWFSMLSTLLVSAILRKTLEHFTASRALKFFRVLEKNPFQLKNSTGQAEPLFTVLT